MQRALGSGKRLLSRVPLPAPSETRRATRSERPDWIDALPTEGIDVTIYVNTDVAQAELARRISDAVDGTLTGWNAKAGTYEIDIDTNDDRLRGEVDPDDAFLFYPYLVEVEWLDPEASTAEKVEAVSAIMRALDGLGAEYVTAADFEQELPRAGRSSPSSRKN